MYEKYFGFNTLPFSVSPDPRFFYDNRGCREAFAGLRYGIEGRKGFTVLTGEAGTGKTTLVKVFIQRAEANIRTAFIIDPKLTATELLEFVLNDLGITPSARGRGALTVQLNDYLSAQLKQGHIVTLLVDEAQQLSDELFEELRLLSNLETNEEKLIQIVLLGQPELEDRLDRPELRQLKQRVTLHCRLAPLDDQEVNLYIQARLGTAGFEGEALFDPRAVEKIGLYTNGIPRLINVVCDNALLTCYALSKKHVSAEIVEEVACDLQLITRPLIEKARGPRLSERPKDQRAVGDEPRVLEKADPSAAVLQGPLPELPSFFMGGEQRRTRIPWRHSLAGFGTGFVFGILAAAGLGAIFYAHANKNDILEVATRTGQTTDQRESLKTVAPEPGALHEEPSKELNDGQLLGSEKAPLVSLQPQDSDAGVNDAPILEESKSDASHVTDSSERSQERQAAEKDEKTEEKITTSANRASESQVRVARAPTNDRLAFEIYKAIANRAITGIGVSVVDGRVVLGGRVASESQRIAAGQAARSVPGVKNVRNQIRVNDGVDSRRSDARAGQPGFGG
jgi:type II secretory pathway predicted ATPase ExeA